MPQESVATRIESAKGELSRLTKEIESLLKTKRDETLHHAAASKVSSSSLAPIRVPPSTKLRRTLKGHFGKVTALHWATDSQRLVSASQDGNLLVWNAVTTNKLQSIPLKSSYVMSVGMEPTHGNMVACGGLDNLCTIYKLNANTPTVATPLVEMASHDGFLSCCRFFNEQHIVTSSGDSTCIRWDILTGKVLETYQDHKADVMFVAIPPSSSNGSGASGAGNGASPSSSSSSSNIFVSASVDRTVKLWDVRTPQSSVQTYAGYHTGDINGVDWMPTSDGKVFASCSEDQTVRIYDIRAYNSIATFGGKTGTTTGAGDHNTNGGGGGGTEVGGGAGAGGGGDTTTTSNATSLEGYTSVSFSKSGRLVFCGHVDGSILAFDVLASSTSSSHSSSSSSFSPTTPAFVIPEAHEQVVSCLGVSPHGDALCTGSWDGMLKIWA